MIRHKQRMADLKHGYGVRLLEACALSLALHAASFLLIPDFSIDLRARSVPPVILKLEAMPQTRQHIPLQLRVPTVDRQRQAVKIPPAEVQRPPLRVITEFALEEDAEAVEFWMLERQPLVRTRVLPEYPAEARAALVEGKVYVRMLLDTHGRVARLGRITGPAVFHEAAVAAARQWEFTPAIQNERPVMVWVSVPFVFKLERPGSR